MSPAVARVLPTLSPTTAAAGSLVHLLNGATLCETLQPLLCENMKLPSGLKILENREGSGPMAESGQTIVYNVRIFLNQGDEIPINETQIKQQGFPVERIRRENDQVFVDHILPLGKRRVIAGIEKALLGMRVGGFRKVRISPHLAYRDLGLPGLVPPDAVLNVSLWLREIVAPSNPDERTR